MRKLARVLQAFPHVEHSAYFCEALRRSWDRNAGGAYRGVIRSHSVRREL